jgi:adenine-specific DNA-methyltransferase
MVANSGSPSDVPLSDLDWANLVESRRSRIRARDKYQAHFTNSAPITQYMVHMLQPRTGDLMLEPAAGHGVFVEAVLQQAPDIHIDAYELNETSFVELKGRFSDDERVSLINANTLLQSGFSLSDKSQCVYDRIIANPPYGAWLEYSERDCLKVLYPGIYTKETYALFLALCIRLLKDCGRLVFIIPETFLTLHRHSRLREILLTQCKVLEIAIFPSHFFPGASFQYAKLSIITLEKTSSREACLNNTLSARYEFSKPEMLLDANGFDGVNVCRSQGEVYQAADHAFLLHEMPTVTNILHSAAMRLGDIADCVTGFYSGDDQRFLRHNSPDARSAKRYPQIGDDLVTFLPTNEQKITGIRGERKFVPIRKGGSAEYVSRDRWFMDWSCEAVRHYKTDKKARYQNAQYYFQQGIGVPMVSSKRVKAALIRGELFDQSIVGIFPRDRELIFYLLGLFNSATGNTLVRTVNPSANNSANYLKKIPIVIPDPPLLSEITRRVSGLVAEMDSVSSYPDLISFRENIDEAFKGIYGF